VSAWYHNKKPKFICIAGIDGSGKSTVSKNIVDSARQEVKHIWARWEPFFLKPFTRLVNRGQRVGAEWDGEADFKRKKSVKKRILKNPFIKELWLLAAEIDYLLQLIPKVLIPYCGGKSIICDRYIYDFYIDQMINLGKTPSDLKGCIQRRCLRVFPKPDLLFYIKIKPDTGSRRKSDGTSVPYLEERKKYYDELMNIYRSVEIDGEKTEAEVYSEIMSNLKRCFGTKNG